MSRTAIIAIGNQSAPVIDRIYKKRRDCKLSSFSIISGEEPTVHHEIEKIKLISSGMQIRYDKETLQQALTDCKQIFLICQLESFEESGLLEKSLRLLSQYEISTHLYVSLPLFSDTAEKQIFQKLKALAPELNVTLIVNSQKLKQSHADLLEIKPELTRYMADQAEQILGFFTAEKQGSNEQDLFHFFNSSLMHIHSLGGEVCDTLDEEKFIHELVKSSRFFDSNKIQFSTGAAIFLKTNGKLSSEYFSKLKAKLLAYAPNCEDFTFFEASSEKSASIEIFFFTPCEQVKQNQGSTFNKASFSKASQCLDVGELNLERIRIPAYKRYNFDIRP